MNFHIFSNDRVNGDAVILGHTCLHVFHPFVLQGSEDPHVQWLELVSHFGGQAVKNDRRAGSVAEPLHFSSFMQCMTVND